MESELRLDADNNEATTNVQVTAEPALIDVTVPTTIPITFKADGSVQYSETNTITNNSDLGAIKVESWKLVGKDGWKVNQDLMSNPEIGTKEIAVKFELTGDGADGVTNVLQNGSAVDSTGWQWHPSMQKAWTINAQTSQNIKIIPTKYARFLHPETGSFDLIIKFAWNE